MAFWKAFRQGWPIFKVTFLPPLFALKTSGVVVVSDSNLAEEVLKGKDFGVSSFLAERFGYTYGPHVMMAIGGEDWKRHRRIISPIFHRQHVQYALDVVVGHVSDFVNMIMQQAALSESNDTLVMDMRKPVNELTMKIGADVAFGYGLSEDERTQFASLYHTIDSMFGHMLIFRLPVKIWKFFYPDLAKELELARDTLQNDVIMPMIRKRREDIARGNADRYDLLSLMLQATDGESVESQRLSEKELVQEALFLFQAGFDTLTNTCLWVFATLGKNRVHGTACHMFMLYTYV